MSKTVVLWVHMKLSAAAHFYLLFASYFWMCSFFLVMWNWTFLTVGRWRAPPTWWVSSEEVSSQVRARISGPSLPFLIRAVFKPVVTVRFFCVHRQIRDLREPQGQLGSRCHRPKQWDVCHAGTVPSAWHEGQAGWACWWVYERLIVLFIGRDEELICAPLCGRKMEASKVHNLRKLGSWGVWPHWLGRIRRGSHSKLPG